MKEGSREIVRVILRVAVLPISQVTFDDLHEGGIIQESLAQSIEYRGKTGNADSEKNASMTQYPMCFTQRFETIGAFSQVIQGTKQEHNIDASIRTLKAARVTDHYLCKGSVGLRLGSLPSQFHVQWMRID